MSDTTDDWASRAIRHLTTVWRTAENIRPKPNADIDYRLATAKVYAQLDTAAAIREQTAVFRQLLDEARAASRDLAEKAGA